MALFSGGTLVLWGLIAYVSSSMGENSSPTALIPAFLGLPLVLSGWMARKNPDKTKLWMHVAVVFGLIGTLGGLMAVPEVINWVAGTRPAMPLATISRLILLLVCGHFTFRAIISFSAARRAGGESGDADSEVGDSEQADSEQADSDEVV
jgi:hypothetical protein